MNAVASNSPQRRSLLELKAIARTVDSLLNLSAERRARTLATGLAVTLLWVLVSAFVPEARLASQSGAINVAACLGLGLCAAALVYWLHPARSKLEARLDQQLARYQPVDGRAHAHLREEARVAGTLDVQLLQRWMEKEGDAVKAQMLSVGERASISLPGKSLFVGKGARGREGASIDCLQQQATGK